MGEPITWRNVTGTNPAEALRPMQAAQQSFTDSLGSLEKMLLNAQQQATNIENRKLDDTEQQYRTFLDGFANPDDLLAARAEQQQRFQSLDPRIQARVREADEQRYSLLADMRTKELAISDDKRQREEEPIRDGVLTLGHGGDIPGAIALLEKNPNIRNRADIMKELIAAQREGRRFQWDANAEARAEASHAQSQKLGKLNLSAAEKAQADSEEQRRFDQYIAREQLAYRGQQQQLGLKLGEVARKNGLPVTAEGMPNIGSMTKEQTESLRKLGGKDFTSWRNDTAFANQFYTGLNGKFRPDLITANESRIRSGFTSAAGPLVGADAANAARADAERDVILDAEQANNWMIPGSESVGVVQANLEKEIPTLMGDSYPNESIADAASMLKVELGKILQEGIPVTIDNKEVRLIPPANIIRTSIAEAEGSWRDDSARAANFVAILKKRMQSPHLQALAKNAAEFEEKNRLRKVEQKLLGKK